jgi:hypothetical protein
MQIQEINISIIMSNLKQHFLNVLTEREDDSYNPDQDEAALADRLAKDEVAADALDVEPAPSNVGYQAEVETANSWIENIDQFINYLNDTEDGSINAQINVLDRDNSVFKGIASRLSDRMARVASDLAEIKEIIAGFVIAADRKAKNIKIQDSLNLSQLPINERAAEKLSRYGFEVASINQNSNAINMVFESDETSLRAEINEDGMVNGESIDSYLDRLAKEYNIEQLVEDENSDIVEEDVVMDEKILKQIKDIDEKLAAEWNQDLYTKRRALVDKMQKPYIDVAKSLMKDGE